MLPPLIDHDYLLHPAYLDIVRGLQLLLLLLTLSRLRVMPSLRLSSSRPLRTEPLLLQEDRLDLKSPPRRLPLSRHLLCATQLLSCTLLLARSAILLRMDPACVVLDPNSTSMAGWCACRRAVDAVQWALCLLLVAAEWRAHRHACRRLRCFWLLSCLVALADALSAITALRLPADVAATWPAVVQLVSLAPALVLALAALFGTDTPAVPGGPEVPSGGSAAATAAATAATAATTDAATADAIGDAGALQHTANRASYASRFTLHWMAPLLSRGRRAPLEQHDLFALHRTDQTAPNAARLARTWAREQRASEAEGGPSFFRAMRRAPPPPQ